MSKRYELIANDAVWAAFYRDGKTLGEICDEFGVGVYDLSPWLAAPINSAIMEMNSEKNDLREAITDLLVEAKSSKKRLELSEAVKRAEKALVSRAALTAKQTDGRGEND